MARPTPFLVRLPDGQERFVCCAIDALSMAPMVGERVEVLGKCHHCGDPLSFTVHPDNPGSEAEGVMVWIGRRCEGEQRFSWEGTDDGQTGDGVPVPRPDSHATRRKSSFRLTGCRSAHGTWPKTPVRAKS